MPADLALGEGRLPPRRLGLLQCRETVGLGDLLPQQRGIGQHHRRHGQRRAGAAVSRVAVQRNFGVSGDVLCADGDHRLRSLLPRLHRVVSPEPFCHFNHSCYSVLMD